MQVHPDAHGERGCGECAVRRSLCLDVHSWELPYGGLDPAPAVYCPSHGLGQQATSDCAEHEEISSREVHLQDAFSKVELIFVWKSF